MKNWKTNKNMIIKTTNMKIVELQKLELDVNKFPHLLSIQERIDETTSLITKLNLRKALINEGKNQNTNEEKKTIFQSNEDEILIIKTNWELAKCHKNLAEKVKYVKEFTERLITYIDEINENFENMRLKAFSFVENNKNAKNNETLKALKTEFAQIKDTDLDENWEVRVKHYIMLKSIFDTSKKTK